MQTFSFHEGPLPPGFIVEFTPALFNTPDFLFLQAATGWRSYYLLDSVNARAVAAMHVHLDGEEARSPLRAPFGSVEASPHLAPRALFDFITSVEEEVRAHGVSVFYIKNPPRAYDPSFISPLETFLLNKKYVVSCAEPGAVVPVTDNTFEEGIRHSEALRLRQARRAGFEFVMLSETDLAEVYGFIEACHGEKGYPMSISFDKLRETVHRFPNRYVLSAVKDQGLMRAAAVSIRVTQSVLYNFMVNHEKRFNALSPPVMLMEGLYGYCQANGIALLDLGTSARDGAPNFPLLDFKLRLGGVPTTKFSFHKKLV